ncbi:MAG: hypothetical protein F9K40_14575 [Kofleriaceae bacterium]|nr:MAG: hypothetical protein F9K40_14575 [Kofleriaceae bacterium]MBZ0235812.1 hypothetical protein [Kofleriaceae bacterium]
MSRRSRLEKVEGFLFDVVLVAVAAMVASDEVQAWLLEHPRELYYGMSALHVIAFPALICAVVAGYGKSEQAMQGKGSNVLVWATVLFFGCSFIVPGVLGLALDQQLWVMMATIFGPLALLVIAGVGIVHADKRKWIAPVKVGAPKPWWKVQLLALLAWAYLLWMETMMLVAAEEGGVLAETGLPIGVVVDYVPVRVMLYYLRDTSRWELVTIVASTLHLLWRLAAA